MPFFVSKFRKIQVFKDCIVEHFYKYKMQYLILGVIVLSALIVGLIAGFKKVNEATLATLPDVTFGRYLQNTITLGQLFVSRLFSFVGILILIWLLHFNKWLGLLSVIILIYNAFVVGCTCAILMSLCKFGVFIMLIYIPCHLLTLFCLIAFTAVCINFSFDTCNSGVGSLSKEFFDSIKFVLIAICLLQLVACILEILLLPWINSAIIIT